MCPAYYRQRDGIVKSVPGLIQRRERGFGRLGPGNVPRFLTPSTSRSQSIVIDEGAGGQEGLPRHRRPESFPGPASRGLPRMTTFAGPSFLGGVHDTTIRCAAEL